MIKLLPNTRFPYALVRGTQTQREKLTERINKNIYKNILKMYDNTDYCSVKKIESVYNNSLPEKKDVKIYPIFPDDKSDIALSGVMDYKGDFYRYWIEIIADKAKKLDIIYLPDLMHESTHVLDFLTQPKYIANQRKMTHRHLFERKYIKIYEDNFDKEISKDRKDEELAEIDKNMRQALENVSFNEKIVFLNYLRYSMRMEKHAYNQDLKFAGMQYRMGKTVGDVSLEDEGEKMAIKEKLEIINKYLAEEIQKERSKIRLKQN